MKAIGHVQCAFQLNFKILFGMSLYCSNSCSYEYFTQKGEWPNLKKQKNKPPEPDKVIFVDFLFLGFNLIMSSSIGSGETVLCGCQM